MDLKKEAALRAVELVTDKAIIGLGAGSTIAFMAAALQKTVDAGIDLSFITSSYSTLQLLNKLHLPVLTATSLSEIDIYFDGCDQLDKQLNALKSGGGIHTQEKLLASMAKQFVLVGDESKLVDQFHVKYPLVLEILPQACTYVIKEVINVFKSVKIEMRMGDKKDGPVITENGNYLADIFFEDWPPLASINPVLKSITGIVDTSLFFGLAKKAVIAGKEGVVVLEK